MMLTLCCRKANQPLSRNNYKQLRVINRDPNPHSFRLFPVLLTEEARPSLKKCDPTSRTVWKGKESYMGCARQVDRYYRVAPKEDDAR